MLSLTKFSFLPVHALQAQSAVTSALLPEQPLRAEGRAVAPAAAKQVVMPAGVEALEIVSPKAAAAAQLSTMSPKQRKLSAASRANGIANGAAGVNRFAVVKLATRVAVAVASTPDGPRAQAAARRLQSLAVGWSVRKRVLAAAVQRGMFAHGPVPLVDAAEAIAGVAHTHVVLGATWPWC